MIYLTEETRDGFLTALLAAWGDEEAVLLPKDERPLGPCVEVVPDPQKAQRALCRFQELDGGCVREIDRLLRCGDEGHMQTAFRYLLLIAKRGGPVRGMLSHPDVLKAEQAMRRVAHEIDRMKGFVRFSESASGALCSCAFLRARAARCTLPFRPTTTSWTFWRGTLQSACPNTPLSFTTSGAKRLPYGTGSASSSRPCNKPK